MLIMSKCQGFSLAELLLSMALGSIIMLAASQTLPILRQHSLMAVQRYQLAQTLEQLAFTLEKELRRSGFCNRETCPELPWLLGQAEGEARGSCLIVTYELPAERHNQVNQRRSFAYRLFAGRLEAQRGKQDCQGAGWEGLTDEKTITLTQFQLQLSPSSTGRWLTLQLAGQMRHQPSIQLQLYRQLRLGGE